MTVPVHVQTDIGINVNFIHYTIGSSFNPVIHSLIVTNHSSTGSWHDFYSITNPVHTIMYNFIIIIAI
jgi:hypothetical protein